jgi:integrase
MDREAVTKGARTVKTKTAITTASVKAAEDAVDALRRAGVADSAIEAALAGMGLNPAALAPQAGGRSVSNESDVKAARPGIYRVTLAKRLYLKKTTRATGSYFLRYRTTSRAAPETVTRTVGGKQRIEIKRGKVLARSRHDMGLGSISVLSLAEARARADELGVRLNKEANPLSERYIERAAKTATTAAAVHDAQLPTMAKAITAYFDDVTKSWRHQPTAIAARNQIMTHAVPVIGHLKIDEIQPRHILAILSNIDGKTHKGGKRLTSVGNKVRSRLGTIFSWLKSHGYHVGDNPADARVINAGRAKSQETEGHYARIDVDAVPETFRRLHALATAGNTALACWSFMALTAARPGDALAAKWEDVDLERKLWKNPVSKTGAALDVPLSSPVVELLTALRATRQTGLIFAGATGGRMAHSNLASAPKRAGIDAGTPHSWRSIFRDLAEDRCNIRPETAEAALGHSLGKIARAYRRETGIEARRIAMEVYAGYLLGETAGNVITFPKTALHA